MKKKSNKNSLIKGGRAGESVKVKTKRGRTKSSAAWLERQLNDVYVQQAKKEGYRSRAVYKLQEMHETFGIFKAGQNVVDLGAAPGGWCQYATKLLKGDGKVVGVDLLDIDPIDNCTFIKGDFTEDEIIEEIRAELGNGKADIVLSDMAPNTTGHAKTDHLRIMYILEIALDFALMNLQNDGTFVAKVFQGGTEKELLDLVKKYFKKFKHFKPEASRKESSEMYIIALGFREERLQDYINEVYGEDYEFENN